MGGQKTDGPRSTGDAGPAPEDIRRLGGQLRVSLTPRCQIRCRFCHNEGDVPPHAVETDTRSRLRPQVLRAEQYSEIIATLVGRGFTRVSFTGGEPLVSHLARPVLEALPEHQPSEFTATLITNGLLIPRHADWLAVTALDRVKVSLHYLSNDSMAEIAGVRRIQDVLAGIELARSLQLLLNESRDERNARRIEAR